MLTLAKIRQTRAGNGARAMNRACGLFPVMRQRASDLMRSQFTNYRI